MQKRAVRIEIQNIEGYLVAALVLPHKSTLIASVLEPPRESPTRQLFLDLCSAMVGEMIREFAPDATIETRIMGQEGHG
jgi:hypothetical protein